MSGLTGLAAPGRGPLPGLWRVRMQPRWGRRRRPAKPVDRDRVPPLPRAPAAAAPTDARQWHGSRGRDPSGQIQVVKRPFESSGQKPSKKGHSAT